MYATIASCFKKFFGVEEKIIEEVVEHMRPPIPTEPFTSQHFDIEPSTYKLRSFDNPHLVIEESTNIGNIKPNVKTEEIIDVTDLQEKEPLEIFRNPNFSNSPEYFVLSNLGIAPEVKNIRRLKIAVLLLLGAGIPVTLASIATVIGLSAYEISKNNKNNIKQ